jgi:hypothetical protein
MLLATFVAALTAACPWNVANDLRPQPRASQLITVAAATTRKTYASVRSWRRSGPARPLTGKTPPRHAVQSVRGRDQGALMKLRSFTSVMVGVVAAIALAAAVAPTASRASNSYSAGHFMLSVDGTTALLEAPGGFSSGNALVLRGGTATPALVAWAKGGALMAVNVVEYDRHNQPVARYYLENAWPALGGETITLEYQHIMRL